MKNNYRKKILIILVSCICSFTAFAKIAPARLQQFILEDKQISNAELKEFYSRINYKTAWIQQENVTNRAIFFNILNCLLAWGYGKEITSSTTLNLFAILLSICKV